MSAPRLYLPRELSVGERVRIEGDPHRHLATVLRLGPGAEVNVFNGKGGYFESRIVAAERRATIVELVGFTDRECESPLRVTLAQALSRGDRMDYSLQKSAELGVARLRPLLSRRAAPCPSENRLQARMRHWQRVLASACEQCGRNRLPLLDTPRSLESLLADCRRSAEDWLVLSPQAGRGLPTLERPGRAVTVLVGPEAGWEPAELDAMTAAGVVDVKLGPRTLRTETAAAVAVAALQLLWGDLVS